MKPKINSKTPKNFAFGSSTVSTRTLSFKNHNNIKYKPTTGDNIPVIRQKSLGMIISKKPFNDMPNNNFTRHKSTQKIKTTTKNITKPVINNTLDTNLFNLISKTQHSEILSNKVSFIFTCDFFNISRNIKKQKPFFY